MDELTLLRNFQSDTPGPTPAETASARARLLAAIDAPPASARDAASWRLRAGLRRLGRPRFWAPAAAAAAVTAVAVTAALLAAPGPGIPHPSGHQPVNGPALLREAAAAAARQPAGQGSFYFTRQEAFNSITGRPFLQDTWIGTGAPGRAVAAGQTYNLFFPDIEFGLGYITWSQLRHLPLAPDRLLARIVAASGGHPTTEQELATVANLLTEYPAGPALRSALYRVAALLPGLRFSYHHDLVGRPAVEALVPFRSPRSAGIALFFDPATGTALGVADLFTSPHQCPSPASETAVLSSGWTNSKYQMPPGTPPHAKPVVPPTAIPTCRIAPVPTPSPFPTPTSSLPMSPSATPASGFGSPAPTPTPSPIPPPRPTPSPTPSPTT
jgi:hypothetical protein